MKQSRDDARFPLFNGDSTRDQLLDLFFSPPFINTIQTSCPWILRYLTAAVITGRGRTRNSGQYQKQLKDIIRIVKQEVNLIRDTRVDAKIDYKEGTVVMNHPPSSVYQQVIERTKGGFFRTQVLSAALAR